MSIWEFKEALKVLTLYSSVSISLFWGLGYMFAKVSYKLYNK